MVSYKNLWHQLIDHKMTKTQLRMAAGISSVTLAKLSKDEPVNAATLEKICTVLNCRIGDVMEFVPNAETTNGESK